MKWLQAVVAVLTVLLFLARQNVYAGVCPVKTCSLTYCGDSLSSASLRTSSHSGCARARCSLSAGLALPKHKRDPKIRVDNEDIDYPVD
ncbi:hypothetical protein ABMA28_017342 [Loxostege sticticalis]|uniref:Secreted protein n=1 Tax=Loxostege sticticalis TaxID=481309 RepID=A0ABD0S298_LOXSC